MTCKQHGVSVINIYKAVIRKKLIRFMNLSHMLPIYKRHSFLQITDLRRFVTLTPSG